MTKPTVLPAWETLSPAPAIDLSFCDGPAKWPAELKVMARDLQELLHHDLDLDAALAVVSCMLDASYGYNLYGEVSRFLSAMDAPCGDLATAARLRPLKDEAARLGRVLPFHRTSHPNAVHGTPITPRSKLERLRGASFCVSYFAPSQLEAVIPLLGPDSMLLLDNGAFSAWRAGLTLDAAYWERYWCWATKILARVDQAVAVIPDVIDGRPDDNLSLINDALDRVEQWENRLMPVWHLHEPLEQLQRVVDLGFRWIAFGSSGEYSTLGTAAWDARIEAAFTAIERTCDVHDDLHPRVHMMRGLGQMPRCAAPFASADSTNIARNHARQAARGEGIEEFHQRIESQRFPVPGRPLWPHAAIPSDAPRLGAAQMNLLFL